MILPEFFCNVDRNYTHFFIWPKNTPNIVSAFLISASLKILKPITFFAYTPPPQKKVNLVYIEQCINLCWSDSFSTRVNTCVKQTMFSVARVTSINRFHFVLGKIQITTDNLKLFFLSFYIKWHTHPLYPINFFLNLLIRSVLYLS